MSDRLFSTTVTPDWEGFVQCIRRQGVPRRVHNIELFLDAEVQEAICQRFDLLSGLNPADPYFGEKREIAIQRFLGYDFVSPRLEGMDMPLKRAIIADTAELQRDGGRRYMEEHAGPITNWREFEEYPWPDPATLSTRSLEWFQKNLPDDMCVLARGPYGHYAEYITWLMGYETLCYALYDQRDLVAAIVDKITVLARFVLEQLLQFECVKVVWGSDDMGFNTSTMISPADLRAFVFPGHKEMAQMCHAAGRPYILHACGNLEEIMPDLIDDVGIDGKHSFEDVIQPVIEFKRQYGQRISVLGGIDVDFMCRASEAAVRRRVRETLDACLPGGGYCLGTGNSVANYIPLNNYLAMLDEGRRYTA